MKKILLGLIMMSVFSVSYSIESEEELYRKINDEGKETMKVLVESIDENFNVDRSFYTEEFQKLVEENNNDFKRYQGEYGEFVGDEEYERLGNKIQELIATDNKNKVNKLIDEGYSEKIAKYYIRNNIDPKKVKHLKHKQVQYWIFENAVDRVNNNIGNSVDDYIVSFSKKNKIDFNRAYEMDVSDLRSPYRDKGNIVYVEFNQMFQLLGEKTALYNKRGKVFYVEFNNYAEDRIGGNFVITGAYKYTNTMGSQVIAYHLKQIKY